MAEVNPYQPELCAFPGCHHPRDWHALSEKPPYVRKECAVGAGPKGVKCACTQFIAAMEHTS